MRTAKIGLGSLLAKGGGASAIAKANAARGACERFYGAEYVFEAYRDARAKGEA